MLSQSNLSAIMAISIAAIVIAGISIFISTSLLDDSNVTSLSAPQIREVQLFSQVDENIDEGKFGIPPDQFSQTSIIVNKGDTVKISFYNLEPIETQEHHTFTMTAPYEMDHDINAGDNTEILFTASQSGIFDYVCTFHEPTMRGQLVVLD